MAHTSSSHELLMLFLFLTLLSVFDYKIKKTIKKPTNFYVKLENDLNFRCVSLTKIRVANNCSKKNKKAKIILYCSILLLLSPTLTILKHSSYTKILSPVTKAQTLAFSLSLRHTFSLSLSLGLQRWSLRR